MVKLKIMELSEKSVNKKNPSFINYNLDLCTLKSLEKEFIIVNDFQSWDLLVLDDEGRELKRIKGKGTGAPGYARAIKTRYCDDSDYVLWMKSPTEMSIVDMGDFGEIPLPNFWTYKGLEVCCTAVAANETASKIAGIGFVQELNNIQTLHLWEIGSVLSIIEMKSIHRDCAAWLSIETSKDSKTVFIGGASNLSLTSEDAFLFAISFDQNATVQGFKRYNSQEADLNCVNVIRRYPYSLEEDVLILGGSGLIIVTLFSQNQFHTIQKIQTFSANPICDIATSENILFAATGLQKAMCCYFDPMAAEINK